MISVCFGWSAADRPAKRRNIGHPHLVVNHPVKKSIGVPLVYEQ
jgi:hypothetical protein